MAWLIVRRVLLLAPLLLAVTIVAFLLVLLIPGDPAVAIAGESATLEQIESTRERLGLDDPLLEQYGTWASGALRGDLGTSLFGERDVVGTILQRVPATLSLTLLSVVFSLAISIPAGIVAARRQGSAVDRLVTLGASLGIAIPNFWLAMMLILLFSIWMPLLPATGYVPFSESPLEWFRHIALPAFALGTASAAETTRQLRSALVEVLDQDYVRTAHAVGLRHRTVIAKHALKNAAIPVVTVLGLQMSLLLGGSIVVEQVFGIPGIGQLALRSVLERDLPMIQGIVVVAAVIVLIVNLLVDLSYVWLNPKVRAV